MLSKVFRGAGSPFVMWGLRKLFELKFVLARGRSKTTREVVEVVYSVTSLFPRTRIRNTFVSANVAQIIHYAHANVETFHRVFVLFIWSLGSEKMRQDNLLRSVKSGGLGLMHLSLSEEPSLRIVLDTKLFHALPCFVVSSCQEEPRGMFEYLGEVADACHFLSFRISLECLSVASREKLLKHSTYILFFLPLCRSLFSGRPGKDVIFMIKKVSSPPCATNFFFKVHT